MYNWPNRRMYSTTYNGDQSSIRIYRNIYSAWIADRRSFGIPSNIWFHFLVKLLRLCRRPDVEIHRGGGAACGPWNRF